MIPSRVTPGQRFVPSAAMHNAVVDLLHQAGRRRQPSKDSDAAAPPTATQAYLHNTSETDIPQWGPVRITGPIATREEAEDQFEQYVYLAGTPPTGAVDVVHLAIAAEPIPAGEVGRVVTAGCAVAKVDVVDPDAWFAGCTDDPAALQTCQGGPVEILWREPGASGVKWAVVRLQGLSSLLEFHVTSAAGMAGKPNRYTYELQLSRLDAETMLPADVADGLALPGTNIAEDWNDATQVGGMAIADLPSGLAFYAVGDSPGGWVGATVQGWLIRLDGILQVRFQREMPLLGACSMSAEDQRDALGLGALAVKDVVTGTDLEDEAVSVAKMTASATDVLFGRASAGAGPGEEISCTAAGRALLDDANAAAQRTTLGLGTAAVVNVPASGDAAAGEAVKGSDTRLTNARTPTAHSSTHGPTGSDPIKLDDLATPDDNTDLDASTTRHGLMPKAVNDAAKFYRADGTQAFPHGRSLGINSADSSAIASTNAETNFSLNVSLAAGLMNAVGAAIRSHAAGRLSSTGTPTLTLRIKLGSTTIFDLGAQSVGAVSNQPWNIDFTIVCRSTGASGTVFVVAQVQRVGGRTGTTIGTLTTVDLTAAQTLQISAQWSVSSASNTTVQELLDVSSVNV